MKITFDDFTNIFKNNTPENICHEVLFLVEGYSKYQHSWLGATNRNSTLSYWLGLTPDSTEAYNFSSFDEMVNAPVFEGKSLKEIWDKVDILSFDALEPDYIIPLYLNKLK